MYVTAVFVGDLACLQAYNGERCSITAIASFAAGVSKEHNGIMKQKVVTHSCKCRKLKAAADAVVISGLPRIFAKEMIILY